jgi:hypothetical protein
MSMADFLHELAHNNMRRGYSTPAWQAYFNEHIQGMLTPTEESDDPWQTVVHPTNEDLGAV